MSRRSLVVAIIGLFMAATAVFAQDPPGLGELFPCGPRLIRARLSKFVSQAEFDKLRFELRDAKGSVIPTTVTPISVAGGFGGATLTVTSSDLQEGQFIFLLDDTGKLLAVKPVELSATGVAVDKLRHRLIQATFPCEVDPSQAVVTITRNKKDMTVPATLSADSTGRVLKLTTNTPLMHEDKVTVTADLLGGGKAVVTGEVDFAQPKDIDSSVLYVGGKLELAEDSKPNVLVDLKYDGSYLFPLGESFRWTHGPSLLVDASTQDSEGEGTATLGYDLRAVGAFERPTRFILWRFDASPTLELDDGLNSRNLIADLKYQLGFPGEKWIFRPSIGFEGGKNLALKSELESLSDYTVLRPTLDLYLSRVYERKGVFNEITFTIDTQSRYLLDDEPDADDKLAHDGFVAYGKVSLMFSFTENLGISFEYERGERPPLYGDNNKGGIALVYAF